MNDRTFGFVCGLLAPLTLNVLGLRLVRTASNAAVSGPLAWLDAIGSDVSLLLCFALFSAGPTWFYFDQSAFIDGPTVPAHVVDRSVSKSSGKNSSTSYRLGYIYSYDGDAYEGRSGFGLTLYLCVAAWAAARIRRRPDSES